jgi:Derlin-2/3
MLETHKDYKAQGYIDFLWCCFLAAALLSCLAALTGTYYLGHSLVFALLYIWSRKEASLMLDFWGFKVKSSHLPFVVAALHVAMGGDWAEDAAAVLAGHVVYFCEVVLPREKGWRPLGVPRWLRRLVA